MLNELSAIGLSKNEARVYLALIELHEATASDISLAANVHRVNTYDVLKSLEQKKLIAKIERDGQKLYVSLSPEQLNQIVNEKQNAINTILPNLQKKFKTKTQETQVLHLTGIKGIYHAYNMMLEQNEPIYAIGGSGKTRTYLGHRHELWNKTRKNQKQHIYALYYESTRGTKKSWNDKSVSIRFIPERYAQQGMIDICGDLVINLHPLGDELFATVMKNKIMADTYRSFFDFMFAHAKK